MKRSRFSSRRVKLLHFHLLYLVDIFCAQKSNFNTFSSFKIPRYSALRYDCTHSWFRFSSSDESYAAAGVTAFSGRLYSFLNFQPCISSLDPYSDYFGIKILLKNSSFFVKRLCFSYLLFFSECKSDSFLPFVLPSSRNLFILVTSTVIHILVQTLVERKDLIRSPSLTSFPSITLTS